MAYKALDIANKLLVMASVNTSEDLMSNLKLQKLMYYEQGFHLAMFGTPLFDEEIEAWMYGPVVPSVYEHFKSHGNNGIMPEVDEPVSLNDDEEILFNEVYDIYGRYSAYGLMNMTHTEMPWKSTCPGVGNIISKEKMAQFFKTRIDDEN